VIRLNLAMCELAVITSMPIDFLLPSSISWYLQNVWTPSKVIARLGKEINDESSYLYWAYKVTWFS
jgi:deoxyhypusine synthase